VREGASLMTGVRFSQVDDNQLKWTLASKTARFEDGETRIYFDHPKMDMFENNRLTSRLNAETGFLNMTKKDAQLEKAVRVDSETDGMTLLTARLFFSSEKNKIWTDDPVTILKGKTVTHGLGFTANPDLSEIVITRQETTTLGKNE
jgi:LPS export ABC transporter protein LptC